MARQAMPVSTGDVIDYRNDGDELIKAGDIVAMKSFCGVAETDIEPGASGAVAIGKVWDVVADTSKEFKVGDLLRWDGAKAVNTETPSNAPLGLCVAPKATSAPKARVKLGLK